MTPLLGHIPPLAAVVFQTTELQIVCIPGEYVVIILSFLSLFSSEISM